MPLLERMAQGMERARRSLSNSWTCAKGLMRGVPYVLYSERYVARNLSRSAASRAGMWDEDGYTWVMVWGRERPAEMEAAMAARDGGVMEGWRRWENVRARVWAMESWVSKRVPSKSKMIAFVAEGMDRRRMGGLLEGFDSAALTV